MPRYDVQPEPAASQPQKQPEDTEDNPPEDEEPLPPVEKLVNIPKDSRGRWYKVKFQGRPGYEWRLERHVEIPPKLLEEILKHRTWSGKPRKKKRKTA